MNRCIHGVYIPERLGNTSISDVCSICMSVCPKLDRRYGKVLLPQAILPSNLRELHTFWCNTNDDIAYEKMYFAIQKLATAIATKRFSKKDDIPDWHDAAHDAGVNCCINIKSFNGQSSFSTWAYECIDNFLTNWVTREVEENFSLDDIEHKIDVVDCRSGSDEKIFLKEVKSLLSTQELKLFEMKVDIMTNQAIADTLGVHESTIRKLRWPNLKEKIRLMGKRVQ